MPLYIFIFILIFIFFSKSVYYLFLPISSLCVAAGTLQFPHCGIIKKHEFIQWILDGLKVGFVFMVVISLLSSMISFNPWCFHGSSRNTSGSLHFSPHHFVLSVIPTHLVFIYIYLISQKIIYTMSGHLIRKGNLKKNVWPFVSIRKLIINNKK